MVSHINHSVLHSSKLDILSFGKKILVQSCWSKDQVLLAKQTADQLGTHSLDSDSDLTRTRSCLGYSVNSPLDDVCLFVLQALRIIIVKLCTKPILEDCFLLFRYVTYIIREMYDFSFKRFLQLNKI